MPVGERIRFFRRRKGMTLKQLGVEVGFPEPSAEVRVAQYEAGSRTPKEGCAGDIAQVLGVSPGALRVPDDTSPQGILHTLFSLEDTHGLRMAEINGWPCLTVDASSGEDAKELGALFAEWAQQVKRLAVGEITKQEYDDWRYCHS